MAVAPYAVIFLRNPLMRAGYILLIGLLLVSACASNNTSPATPLPGERGLLGVADLLAGTPVRGVVTVVGYLFVRPNSVVLLDGLSFSATPPPQPLTSDPAQQIWIGPSLESSVVAELSQRAAVRYGIVQARGELQGPGTFGPEGRYRYQFVPDNLISLSPQVVTINDLFASAATYEQQLIRVEGMLLTSEDTVLLVSELGAGGVPAPDSRQLKLPTPLRDQALLGQLSQVADSPIYFGPVQIDGIWRGDVLHPLSITAGKIP